MIFTTYNTEASPDSTFGDNGKVLAQSGLGFTTVFSIAIFQHKLYTAGSVYNTSSTGVLARLLLNKNSIFPLIHITSPGRDTNYIVQSPITLTAAANDPDGTIQSVEFYNDGRLLFVKSDAPYTTVWDSVPAGSYHITAVATDNDGMKTISAPVHITVLHNRPPAVTITSPANGATYPATVAGATIVSSADAIGHGARIKTVTFYNGTKLIHTEANLPYVWTWKNVPAGAYTITAMATDRYGRINVSAPVTITVKAAETQLVRKGGSFIKGRKDVNEAVSLYVAPNPVANILNIHATGLQNSKRSTGSIILGSGQMIQTKQLNMLLSTGSDDYRITPITQLQVSTLVKGVYTIKLVNGNHVVYAKFMTM